MTASALWKSNRLFSHLGWNRRGGTLLEKRSDRLIQKALVNSGELVAHNALRVH